MLGRALSALKSPTILPTSYGIFMVEPAKTDKDTPEGLREVNYEYSNNLSEFLQHLKVSLFFSTYQAGKLGVVTAKDKTLTLSFHNFERAMGMAIGPARLAVGGKDWVYFLKNDLDLAPQIEPAGSYDACFLTKSGQYTGDISIHDLAWGNKELWIVNTRFSCLCTLSNNYNFLPQWQPNFISAIAPEDRCHLNGMAMVKGMPKYVTVLGKTDEAGAWREHKANGGCILEVPSSKTITDGLSMPHSPRFYRQILWVLNSGRGELITVDLKTGAQEVIVTLPGYTRGLAFSGKFAFVGLSKIRETAIFGNLPIGDRHKDLKCGVAVVDLQKREMISCLEFKSGVDEIFDVQTANFSRAMISGPYAVTDGDSQIWSLPASAAGS
ncbi:MAG: TIGR03032 family protein [Cyanobacteria bacterium J06623_7]